MLYAKVVLGIPVDGPFDYLVPETLKQKIQPGVRVRINFGRQDKLGIVIGLSKKTNIRSLKPIIDVLDDYPTLDNNLLRLTKELSQYYCCSWGEAIETAIPADLRKLKKVSFITPEINSVRKERKPELVLLHSLEYKDKWRAYLDSIKDACADNYSSIVLLPDINAALKAKKLIDATLDNDSCLLYRKQPKELDWWLRVKKGEFKVIIGTRSAIFAPIRDLGLIIIDEEQDSVYKQDQVPHYHAREIAIMRSKFEKAGLILGSISPSLEALNLAKNDEIKYSFVPKKVSPPPEIKVFDSRAEFERRDKSILSKYLSDSIAQFLSTKGKILLFLDRKGFATSSYCHSCGAVLKCQRCNINLVYYFQENVLSCNYCNFKMELPKICPTCNSGYIKFMGAGTEKIESEISRQFPGAKIKRLEARGNEDLGQADIFISTSSITKYPELHFDLIGVLNIDNSLNRVDLRATEKTFSILLSLFSFADKKLIIQTRSPAHKCFQALLKNDFELFYSDELKQRKQLEFPPFWHLAHVKLRGINSDRVKQVASSLFEHLKTINKAKGIKILSVNLGQHPKLRGNYYWQILTSSRNPMKLTEFLRNSLKVFKHSGIIVTVDIDPI